ncbi:MAG: MFS transporter [Pseudomonadota bacterium]
MPPNQPTSSRTALAKLISATGLSNVADGIALVVWAWLASLLTRDPILVAILPVALRIPWLLLSIPAGLIVDRTDRRRLILAMDALRTVGFGLAAVSVWMAQPFQPPTNSGTSEPTLFAILVACAVPIGAAEVFRDTATQSILPAIVPEADLERANARLYSAELVGNAMLGPAVGAFLIAWIVWVPFAANALLVLAALGVLHTLKGQFTPAQRAERNWKEELGEGFDVLRQSHFLRVLAWATAVWNFFHQMVIIALILHVQENLGLDARFYGLVLAAGAGAGVAAGFIAERVIRNLGPGRTAQWSSLASAIAFAGICFAPDGLTLAFVLMFFEFSSVFWNVVSISYKQRTIPDHLLGRVNGIYRLLSWGMMSLGLLGSGLLVRMVEGFAARETALLAPFLAGGVAVLVLTAVIWKDLRKGFGDG